METLSLRIGPTGRDAIPTSAPQWGAEVGWRSLLSLAAQLIVNYRVFVLVVDVVERLIDGE